MDEQDWLTQRFEENRTHLRAVAYRMLDAGAWAIQSAPGPGSQPELDSVSCPSTTVCLAVGDDTNGAGNSASLAEQWSAGVWSVVPTGGEGEQTSTGLDSISCTSARSCLTVGSAQFGTGEPMSANTDPVAGLWNGSVFSRLAPPEPRRTEGGDNELFSVSCSSSGHCTGVGYAQNIADGCDICLNLADRLHGERWSLERPSSRGELNAVSCPSRSLCVAIGDSNAQVWNGKRWRFIGSAAPGAVNCRRSRARRDACVRRLVQMGAVGFWSNAGMERPGPGSPSPHPLPPTISRSPPSRARPCGPVCSSAPMRTLRASRCR